MPKEKGFENKLKMTRRQFLKATAAAGAAGSLAAEWFYNPPPAGAAVSSGIPTICPYCSLGCGMIGVPDGSGGVLDIYGDPIHPYNDGAQCSKGASNVALVNSPQRVTTGPKVRYGSAGPWQSISWSDAMSGIADTLTTIKNTSPGIPDYAGADQVAFLGSSHMTNEECYFYRKLIALFGTNNIEHQARI